MPDWAGGEDRAALLLECDVCGKPLTERQAGYSTDTYGEILCHAHQPQDGG